MKKNALLILVLVPLIFYVGKPTQGNAVTTSKIVDVSLGMFHSCALLSGGIVKCWGYNGEGELGLEDTNSRGYTTGQMGANLAAIDFGKGLTVTAIFTGDDHNCAILSDQSLRCWGYNGNGELGLGDTKNRGDATKTMGKYLLAVNLGKNRTAVSVAIGADHTCAILDNNSVKCWGNNSSGQVGLSDMNKNYGTSTNTIGDKLPPVDLGTTKKVTMLSAGQSFTCALIEDGSVLCWGTNVNGAVPRGVNTGGDYKPFTVLLGTGRTATAISSGVGHTCAFLDDKTVKCWGYNILGQLGVGDLINRGDAANEMGDALPVTSIAPALDILEMKCRGYSCCARLENNAEKCWGYNGVGELGLGDGDSRGIKAGQMGDDLPFLDLGTNAAVTRVFAGSYHNCALLADGNLKCWGYNSYGELGLGDTNQRGSSSVDMGDNLAGIDL